MFLAINGVNLSILFMGIILEDDLIKSELRKAFDLFQNISKLRSKIIYTERVKCSSRRN